MDTSTRKFTVRRWLSIYLKSKAARSKNSAGFCQLEVGRSCLCSKTCVAHTRLVFSERGECFQAASRCTTAHTHTLLKCACKECVTERVVFTLLDEDACCTVCLQNRHVVTGLRQSETGSMEMHSDRHSNSQTRQAGCWINGSRQIDTADSLSCGLLIIAQTNQQRRQIFDRETALLDPPA